MNHVAIQTQKESTKYPERRERPMEHENLNLSDYQHFIKSNRWFCTLIPQHVTLCGVLYNVLVPTVVGWHVCHSCCRCWGPSSTLERAPCSVYEATSTCWGDSHRATEPPRYSFCPPWCPGSRPQSMLLPTSTILRTQQHGSRNPQLPCKPWIWGCGRRWTGSLEGGRSGREAEPQNLPEPRSQIFQ